MIMNGSSDIYFEVVFSNMPLFKNLLTALKYISSNLPFLSIIALYDCLCCFLFTFGLPKFYDIALALKVK
jgi:hypothetical protein